MSDNTFYQATYYNDGEAWSEDGGTTIIPNHKIHLKCAICDAELHTSDYSEVTTFAMQHEQDRHKFKK